ncbi:MAG: EFR1 family ferrodoxin [Clostridia bacterium]|nr:EFR1 family ferrodoxin [Clostridia bacterium]
MKHADFYVYSGTGNTYRVARIMEQHAKEKGMDTRLHMIDTKASPEKVRTGSDTMIGLLAPTIGTVQPVSFMQFIIRLPKGNGTRAFLAATGAWTRIGPLFVPGYVGVTLYIAALLMLIKGYRVVGVGGFGMAHNWTSFIPPYPKKLEGRIDKEIHAAVRPFTDRVYSGQKAFTRVLDALIGIPLLPLSMVFVLLAHFMLAKSMLASFKCNGCGACARNCPRKAIKMLGSPKRPYWTFRCEQCMRCVGFCPQKAVEGNIPFLVLLNYAFFTIPLEHYAKLGITAIVGSLPSALITVLSIVAAYFALLLSLALCYWVFHGLNRIAVFNKLFTYTSLTFYWRKYKEPQVSIAELVSSDAQ